MDIIKYIVILIGLVGSILTIYQFFKPEKLPDSIEKIDSEPEYDVGYELLSIRSHEDNPDDEISKEIVRIVRLFDASEFDRIQYMYNPAGFYGLIIDQYNMAKKMSLIHLVVCILCLILTGSFYIFVPTAFFSAGAFALFMLTISILYLAQAKKIHFKATQLKDYRKYLEVNDISIQKRFFKKRNSDT